MSREGSRFGWSRLLSRSGVKIEGGVMVGVQGRGRGQGWGSMSGVKVGGGVNVWVVEVVVKVGGQDRGRGHGWGSRSGKG